MYLEDTHTAFYEEPGPVNLSSCAYLHNYPYDKSDVIFDDKFKDAIDKYPLFTMDDVDKLSDYLKSRLNNGRGMEILERVEKSKFRPSKKLMDHVAEVIKSKSEYVLLDEQLVVYDKVFSCAEKGLKQGKKSVLIVNGGPGTGKSVIAINLMADLLRQGYNAHYATGSRAFTSTMHEALGKRAVPQFKYFSSYMQAQTDEIDVLICDEAHRMWKTSNTRFTPASKKSNKLQIEELMGSSRVSVFFVDDNQSVRPNEIGKSAYIKEHAPKFTKEVSEFNLGIQFRCAGSEAFIGWITNTLEIEKSPNILWEKNQDFDFRVCESPEEIEKLLMARDKEGYSARMTAGYCWEWSMPDEDGNLVNDVVIGGYKRPWNAKNDAKKLAKGIPKAPLWAYDKGGFGQVGCIYTAQGFEFDYAGVIFGNDLVYNFDKGSWEGHSERSFDSPLKRAKDSFTSLVKNTYRVLLSRGSFCQMLFMGQSNASS
jgi:DUF2075 family protein/Mrp family chromosome partitioning ATPase